MLPTLRVYRFLRRLNLASKSSKSMCSLLGPDLGGLPPPEAGLLGGTSGRLKPISGGGPTIKQKMH